MQPSQNHLSEHCVQLCHNFLLGKGEAMTTLYNKNLETDVLFTCCNRISSLESSKFLSLLTREHFHFPPVKAAFHRLLNIVAATGNSVDWSLLCCDPAIDKEFRATLSNWGPKQIDEEDLLSSIDILEQYRIARLLNTACSNVLNKLSEGEFDTSELIASLSNTLSKTTVSNQKLYHFGKNNNMNATVQEILYGEQQRTIKTGFAGYDAETYGLGVNGLLILGSGTGGGKSALGLQLSINCFRQALNVAIVSLEIGNRQYFTRCLSNLSGVSHSKIRTKTCSEDELDHITTTYKNLVRWGKKNDCRLTIYPPVTDTNLSNTLLLLKPLGYDVIVLDYIGLFSEGLGGGSDPQWQQYNEMARQAKRFSEVNECLVIMLVQSDENMTIKFSKNMANHADWIWLWSLTKENKMSNEFTIHQVKGRDMPTTSFTVNFDFSIMRIWQENNSNQTLEDDEKDVETKILADFET